MRRCPLTKCSFVATLIAAVTTGCTPEVRNYIRFPDLFHPGYANQQRGEAIEHDPYPLDDMGPEVVGGRPREYQRPIPEVERAQLNTVPPPSARPIALPSWPPGPPMVTGPPIVTTPYPTTPVQARPFQVQQRSPY
jgi:hypothetical protein